MKGIVCEVAVVVYLLISGIIAASPLDPIAPIQDPEQEEGVLDIASLLGIGDRGGQKISDQIFRNISNRSLSFEVTDDLSVGADIQRDVYNNRDGSYTVLDRVTVGSELAHTINLSPGTVPLFVTLGANQAVSFVNIRQYDHKSHIVPPGSNRNFSDRGAWEQVEEFFEPIGSAWRGFLDFFSKTDEKIEPRYAELWEIPRIPFKIPFHAASLRDLDDDEIVSYILSGSLIFGVGAGYVTDQIQASAGLSYSLNGVYRVSVYKVDDQTVKVGCQWVRGYERGVGGRLKTEDDGITGILFGGDLGFSVVPLRFDASQGNYFTFDLVYEFDLSQGGQVVEAYEQAVLGDLRLAYELSESNLGVTWVVTRDRQDEVIRSQYKVDLILCQFSEEARSSNGYVVITDPQGKRYLFESIFYDDWKERELLTGENERWTFSLQSTIPQDVEGNENEGGHFEAQFQMRNTPTSGQKLEQYLSYLVELTGQREIMRGPFLWDHDYGRILALLHLSFPETSLDAVLTTPVDLFWRAVAIVFGLPPDVWDSEEKRDSWRGPVNGFIPNWIFFRMRERLERGGWLHAAERMEREWTMLKAHFRLEGRARYLADIHVSGNWQLPWIKLFFLLLEPHQYRAMVEVRGDKIVSIHHQWGEYDRNAVDNRNAPVNSFRGGRIAKPAINNINVHGYRRELRVEFQPNDVPERIQGIYLKFERIIPYWLRNDIIYETDEESELLRTFSSDNEAVRFNLNVDLEEGESYIVTVAYLTSDWKWSAEAKYRFRFPRDLRQ